MKKLNGNFVMKKSYWMCFVKAVLFLALPWLLNLYYGALARAPHFSIPPLVPYFGLVGMIFLVSFAAFLLHSGWITDLVIFAGSVGWVLSYFGLGGSWIKSSEVFDCPFVLAGAFLASAIVKAVKAFREKGKINLS